MLISNASRSLPALRDFLTDHLLNNVVPFWMKHAIDPAGGMNTCIRDDGSLVCRDKWGWSQWRAVWVFSTLYMQFGRQQRFLDLAKHIYDFCIKHLWDEQAEGWKLTVDGDGKTLRGYESVYADGFALYGCTAYAKASGLAEPLKWAERTAAALAKKLAMPQDQVPAFPYPPPPGSKAHGQNMSNIYFWDYSQFCGQKKWGEFALELCRDTMEHFYRPEYDLMVERITEKNNTLYPGNLGTAVVPGHVIEDMWFHIHIYRDNNDRKNIERACRIIKRHMEAGWDDEFGGMFLAIDAADQKLRGDAIGWKFADSKLWWPQTECLYGLLLAYEHTKEPWCLQWYDKVHQYAFSHYPVKEHGEWTQRLDRQGKPFNEIVALPVKDPFHLPRVLIYCIDVLNRLTK